MADFSLSFDEVDSVCARMRANAKGVENHLATAGAVEAGPDDFGGNAGGELAGLYSRVLGEVIPASLGKHRDSAQAMTDRLQKMLRTYRSGDDEAVEHLRRATENSG